MWEKVPGSPHLHNFNVRVLERGNLGPAQTVSFCWKPIYSINVPIRLWREHLFLSAGAVYRHPSVSESYPPPSRQQFGPRGHMTGGQRPAFHDQRFGHPPQHIQDIHAQGIYDLSSSPDLIWHVYCFQYNVRENAILKAIRTWVGCGSGTETRYDYDSSWLLVLLLISSLITLAVLA